MYDDNNRIELFIKTINQYRHQEISLGDLAYGIEHIIDSITSLESNVIDTLRDHWMGIEEIYAVTLYRQECNQKQTDNDNPPIHEDEARIIENAAENIITEREEK